MSSTDAELAALARTHLQLHSSRNIPNSYTKALRTHVNLYPNDTNFTAKMTPGTGFGTVKCLEQGCKGIEIPMSRDPMARNGGRDEGFGTLRAYQAKTASSSSPIIPKPSTATASPSSSSSSSHQPRRQSQPLLQRIKKQMSSGGTASILGPSFASTSQAPLVPHVYRKRPLPSDSSDEETSGSFKWQRLSYETSSPIRSALSQKTNLDVKTELIEPSYRLTPPRRLSTSSSSAPAPHRQLQQPPAASSTTSMPKVELNRASTPQTKLMSLKQIPAHRQQPQPSERRWDILSNLVPPRSHSQIDETMGAIQAQERVVYPTSSRTAQQSVSLNRVRPVQLPAASSVKLEPTYAPQAELYPEPHEYRTPSPYSWGGTNTPTLEQELDQALNNNASPGRIDSLMDAIHYYNGTSSHSSAAIGSSQTVNSEPAGGVNWPAPRGLVYSAPAVKKEDRYLSYSSAGSSRFAAPSIYAELEDVKPKVDPYSIQGAYEVLTGRPYDLEDESDDTSEDAHVPNVSTYGAPGYPGAPSYGGYGRNEGVTDFIMNARNAEIFEKDVTVHDAVQYLRLRDLNQHFHGMRIPLLAHQVLGVAWMVKKEADPKKSGGIMADEMGLGKTVQTIATVCFNTPKPGKPKGTLIVAPVALLDQWKGEIESKTNRDFQILVYHGSSKPKGRDAARALAEYDFVLTSYGTLSAEWPENEEFKARHKKKRKNAKKDDFIVVDSDDENSRKKKKGKAKDVKEYSPLFEAVWHRIVLDEAQNIRNRHTRISIAVTDLCASYRWCLTGTPLTNGTADAYGLLRFLQIRPWYEWKEFNQYVVLHEKKDAGLATRRLQLIFSQCLIRRKKDSELEGRKLIELPPKEYHDPEYPFSEEELEIYNFLQARSRAIFNKFLRQGTVLKNYSQVLVLLLRLRQCCVHPALIAQYEDAFLQKGEIRESGEDAENVANELMRAEAVKGLQWVIDVKRRFLEDALERMEAEKREGGDATANQECPICYEPMTDGFHVYCKGCVNNLFETPGQLQDGINGVNENQRPCPHCRTPFAKEHVFGQKVFMPTDFELGLETEGMEDAGKRLKGKGKAKARTSNGIEITSDDDAPMVGSDGDEDYNPSSWRSGSKVSRRSGRNPRNVAYGGDPDDSMDDFIVEDGETEIEKDAKREAMHKQRAAKKGKAKMRVESDDEYGGSQAEEVDDEDEIVEIKKGDYLAKVGIAEPVRQPPMMAKFLPSTKMIAMMRLLQKIRDENPNDKVMLVSQWTSALELCANYLDENHFSYVRYEGSMNRTAREHAVRAFMDTTPENARVMLMSLKAGGVGLNLIRANWVISLDFAWSEAVEAQAFDRTHRLGQTKKVEIHRLCIANTVEGRVKALQSKKKMLADGSLGEGGAKLGRLSVRELAGCNPGQVSYFLYFLDHLHRLHPELGILAKAHLGHAPGYCEAPSEEEFGLSSQVNSAMETVHCLKEAYPQAKIVLVGHSIGGWISTKVLEARPEETEAAFLLMPGLSNLSTTPNGVKLALSVVRAMLRSPGAITSALGMARDEMEMVKDLDTSLLKKYSEKIYLYCASKDDWVGQEKEPLLAALGGPSGKVVEDKADTPHAFVITKTMLAMAAGKESCEEGGNPRLE
ncbi:hypothetical protein FRC04_010468 [Tulasnella sp. 424]|nr:hypothetical protein FRC04_010468 [Tulasnella sp. 424]